MILADANVLLYAVNSEEPHHKPAHAWLDRHLAGREPIGFAWLVVLAFIRLSTHPAVFPHPLTISQALDIVEGWLAQPAAIVVHPTGRHLPLLHGLLSQVGGAANLVNDAHLAALAVEHGAALATFDSDYRRFPGVRVLMPGVD